MEWTVAQRHELALLLDAELSNPARAGAVAVSAGLKPPQPMGVEPSFCWLSRLVGAAVRDGKVDALIEAAAGAVSETTAVGLRGVHVDPEAETEYSEADAETLREEDETQKIDLPSPAILAPAAEPEAAPAAEPEAAAPRPMGTPAQAPPVDGAKSWFVRRVHVGAPLEVAAGDVFDVAVTLAIAAPGTIPTAPADAEPWAGAPVPLEVELWLEEGFAMAEGDLHRELSVPADETKTEMSWRVEAAGPLADGVDMTVRFFCAGYEVGRAKCFVQRKDADVEPRPGAPGALVVPDTILT